MADSRHISTGTAWLAKNADSLMDLIENTAGATIPAGTDTQVVPVWQAPCSGKFELVTYFTGTSYYAGTLALVNRGTSGTLNNTIYQRTATGSITGCAPYTLGAVTGATLDFSTGDVIAFVRGTVGTLTGTVLPNARVQWQITMAEGSL